MRNQMLLQSGCKFLLDLGILGIPGEVDDLPRILGDVIEFLGGTLGESKIVKALETGLVLVIHQARSW